MEKGMAIIERDEVETKAVFIDHEVTEFARQNARTKKRIEDANGAKRKAQKAKARERAFHNNTLVCVLIRGGIIAAAIVAAKAGLVHPVISIPVILLCMCTACIRFGAWLAKTVH